MMILTTLGWLIVLLVSCVYWFVSGLVLSNKTGSDHDATFAYSLLFYIAVLFSMIALLL